MRTRILILGGGTGGTLAANRLRHALGETAQITVVDRDDLHVYQPGLLFVPFGLADADGLGRPRQRQLHDGVDFRLGTVERVEVGESRVRLSDGAELPYDVLIVASGATLVPEETEGLSGPGWGDSIFTFYTLEGARQLFHALHEFEGGRLVVNPIDLPIKCPVAPLEFCFLADWYLRQHDLRDVTELVYVTPLDAAFTRPRASELLSELLERKGIATETDFATGSVDAAARTLTSWDDRKVPFDLLVTIPLHGGAPFVARSPGLGDELGFVETDPATLQAKAAPNVFAIGDATNLPTSKAGSVTHFEGETLTDNVRRFLEGRPLEGSYDGHANCFIETGFQKALLIDFNYNAEPLPGRYPDPHLGPLPLLQESRLNHMAKLAFEWVYWHVLLPGRDLPGIESRMRGTGAAALTTTPEGRAS